jgi:DNA-binding NarL/FixJ family response regulator
MLSALCDAESVYRALRAGASGYVPKFAAGAEVAAAVRSVHAGRRYLGESIAETMVEGYARERQAKSPLESLSRRERQVLQLSAEGHSVPEIGERLSISPRTVETYRARLMEKLGLKDLRELIVFAVEHGIPTTK